MDWFKLFQKTAFFLTFWVLFADLSFADPPTPAPSGTPTPAPLRHKEREVTLDRLEASVNASVILKSDLSAFRKTTKLRSQLDPLFTGTPLALKGAEASDSDIIRYLIDERLILQRFPVTDSEVEQEVNTIQSNNHLDRPRLRQALEEQGFSFSEYFDLIRVSISKRSLIDREIRSKVSISDDDIKNYFYNQYQHGPESSRAFHLELITILTDDYKTPSAAYDTALRAKKALEGGTSFEEVAKRFNSDGSAGDMGVLTEDQMSPLILEQAKKLKIGEISSIFGGPAQHRYMILKLTDVKTSDSDRLNKVKEEIRAQLTAAEYQHQILLWIQRQSSFVHHAGDSLAKELSP